MNNRSSAESFTVIFARARDDKKGKGGAPRPQPQKNDSTSKPSNNFRNSSRVSYYINGYVWTVEKKIRTQIQLYQE